MKNEMIINKINYLNECALCDINIYIFIHLKWERYSHNFYRNIIDIAIGGSRYQLVFKL